MFGTPRENPNSPEFLEKHRKAMEQAFADMKTNLRTAREEGRLDHHKPGRLDHERNNAGLNGWA